MSAEDISEIPDELLTDGRHEDPEKYLEEIARELGPFDPPRDYPLEPEFCTPVPRPIPANLRRGPYAQRLRKNLATVLGTGVICMLFAHTKTVTELSYYILPMGYLDWVAYALLIVAIVMYCSQYLPIGPYAYVHKGICVVARVLDNQYYLEEVRTHGTATAHFGFLSGVEFLHPVTGKIKYHWLKSSTIGSADSGKRYTVPFERGDYVTLVYLPGIVEKTARIYNLLGLNPDSPYILKDGRTWNRGLSLYAASAWVIGIAAFFALFVTAIYAFSFRWPIADNAWDYFKWILPAGFGLGFFFIWLVPRFRRWEDRHSAHALVRYRVHPFMIVLGCMMGSFFLSCCGLVVVNSSLDSSVPQYREVQVVNFLQETHKGIFRKYDIEYQELGHTRTEKYPARKEYMEEFSTTMAGVLEIKAGLLKLPWIRQIHPVELTRFEEANAPEGSLLIEGTDQKSGKVARARVGLTFRASDGRERPVSPKLHQLVFKSLAEMRTTTEESPVETRTSE